MNSHITTKEYALLGVMAAVAFVLAFVLGSAITIATGTPLSAGILNGIIVGVIMTLGVKIVDKFGAAIVIWIVFSIIATPTITFGPPGIQKIAVGLFIAIGWEICISLFKRNNIGYILGGASMGITSILGTFASMVMLGLPGADKMQSALLFLMLLYVPFGAVSAYLGITMYDKKLKNLAVVKMLKA